MIQGSMVVVTQKMVGPKIAGRSLTVVRLIRVDQILGVTSRLDDNRAGEVELQDGCIIVTPQGEVVADESIDDVLAAMDAAIALLERVDSDGA